MYFYKIRRKVSQQIWEIRSYMTKSEKDYTPYIELFKKCFKWNHFNIVITKKTALNKVNYI